MYLPSGWGLCQIGESSPYFLQSCCARAQSRLLIYKRIYWNMHEGHDGSSKNTLRWGIHRQPCHWALLEIQHHTWSSETDLSPLLPALPLSETLCRTWIRTSTHYSHMNTQWLGPKCCGAASLSAGHVGSCLLRNLIQSFKRHFMRNNSHKHLNR